MVDPSNRARTKYPNCTKARYYLVTEATFQKEIVRWRFARCHQADCPRCQSAQERAERMLRRRKSPYPQYKAWQHAAEQLNQTMCSIYLCYDNLSSEQVRWLTHRLRKNQKGPTGYFVTTNDGARHFFVDQVSAEVIRKHLGGPCERGTTTSQQIKMVMELGYRRSGGWGFWAPKTQKVLLEGIKILYGMPSRRTFVKKPQQNVTFSTVSTVRLGTLKQLDDQGYWFRGRDPEMEDRPMPYRNDDEKNQTDAIVRRMDKRSKDTNDKVSKILRMLQDTMLTDEDRKRIQAQLKGSKLIQ